MDKIDVQIVSYRTKAYLGACLERLLPALSDGTIRILENGSGEDLSELASERVHVHTSAVNLGFGAGHNLLAGHGRSDLLCCVNPDAVLLDTDGLQRLAALFADPRVAAAGPALLTPAGEPQRWDHGELRGLRARIANGAGHAHWRPRAKRTEVAWVAGAFMMLRRERFDAIGGFDETYFLYKEDEDLCLRLRQAGGTVLYEPAVTVEHEGSVVARRDERHLGASLARYRDKHGANVLARGLYRVTRRF
jgi:N-acetylglucosaminyl-diphospho-decaprenol L-rhamnosyltransferase